MKTLRDILWKIVMPSIRSAYETGMKDAELRLGVRVHRLEQRVEDHLKTQHDLPHSHGAGPHVHTPDGQVLWQ